MKWIYICSPLRGDYEANTAAAIRYCREVALQGDFPVAPHIYCPRFLDDTKPEERKRGMAIGAELLELCSEVRVYGDHIIRRCYRFGQVNTVNVHIVTSTAEGAVRENIERKERQRADMTAEMVRHTKEILRKEIRGTTRDVIEYNPQVEMKIPAWLIA